MDFGILHRELYEEPAGRVSLVSAALIAAEDTARISLQSVPKE